MNIQQIQQAQQTQPAQIIIDSSTAVQAATGQNANSFYFVQQQPAQQQQHQINYITANPNAIQMTAIKQPFQFVNSQPQQNGQQLQTGYKYIASNQPVTSFSSANASPRIIVQPQQIAANSSNQTSQTYMTIAPAQQQQLTTTTTNNTGANISNTNGQIFLINNRIVPLQSIKQPQQQQQQQQTQQIQRVQVINNQQPQVIYTTNDLSQTSQVQQQQQQK